MELMGWNNMPEFPLEKLLAFWLDERNTAFLYEI
jgi:hypothetical protein